MDLRAAKKYPSARRGAAAGGARPEILLQPGDAAADRGRRQPERGRRGGEPAGLDAQEGGGAVEINVVVILQLFLKPTAIDAGPVRCST